MSSSPPITQYPETSKPSPTVSPQLLPTATPDDVFNSLGSWEDYAKENNIRAAKKRRRQIPRLRDESEWKEPSITQVHLVPNPFVVKDVDSDSESKKIQIKRVCFNATISFHYY
ncbi:hypothetical protein GCK72_004021 [Caenorhabditis remanei]|uniref:Uncharacterized protein n=1 Tax=Caenorhabditis remanei TaxID=31234 RepID=A0A6A5HA62_CAERE|nr:hypothetical protein GCK72_004021 [Caenorhabditis remanei]KAF1764075.1 hypothetical protein GCK72_004021 [Caenorhabditis remanei]